MEYDRRRATGRWAELGGRDRRAPGRAGPAARASTGAPASTTRARRAETRAMLRGVRRGVNAFLHAGPGLADRVPAPRHAARALGAVGQPRRLQDPSRRDGALADEALARPARAAPRPAAGLVPVPAAPPRGPMLILPPGTEYRGAGARHPGDALEHDAVLAALPGWVGGSNNWVLAGARTASGRPARSRAIPTAPLDTPNCYYQNHLACPDFDAIGLSFPGVPGLSHFGHNRARGLVRHPRDGRLPGRLRRALRPDRPDAVRVPRRVAARPRCGARPSRFAGAGRSTSR